MSFHDDLKPPLKSNDDGSKIIIYLGDVKSPKSFTAVLARRQIKDFPTILLRTAVKAPVKS